MRKILLILALVIVVLLAALAGLVFSAFSGRQAITDGFELGAVRVVKDGIVSFGVVRIGEGEVALVDAGNDPAGKAILAELARRRLGPEAVKAILLTHGHRDHIAGAPLFPQAQVMALAADAALAEGRAGNKGPLTRFMPVKPTGFKVTRLLADGETFTLGQTDVRVYAVPGHSAGSAAYLIDGALFFGDAADATSAGRVTTAPWIFSESLEQDRAALIALQQRLVRENADVKVLIFAHSGVLDRGLAPLADFAAAK